MKNKQILVCPTCSSVVERCIFCTREFENNQLVWCDNLGNSSGHCCQDCMNHSGSNIFYTKMFIYFYGYKLSKLSSQYEVDTSKAKDLLLQKMYDEVTLWKKYDEYVYGKLKNNIYELKKENKKYAVELKHISNYERIKNGGISRAEAIRDLLLDSPDKTGKNLTEDVILEKQKEIILERKEDLENKMSKNNDKIQKYELHLNKIRSRKGNYKNMFESGDNEIRNEEYWSMF
jgi:hypothetical protein